MLFRSRLNTPSLDILNTSELYGGVDMDFKQGGKALQEKRKNSGLTQEALGERAGVSTVTVSRIERGVLVPSLSTLICLCNALETGSDSILAAYIHAASPVRWSPLVQKLENLDADKKRRAEAMIESILDNI